MKTLSLFLLTILMLTITSCWPVDTSPTIHTLENIESSIEPEKKAYNLSDSISLKHSFMIDSDKFHAYEYHISVYPHDDRDDKDDWLVESVTGHILIYDDSGNDITNRPITYSLKDNSKVTKEFTLVPKKRGKYLIYIGGRALLRYCTYSLDSYESGHIYYINVE